MNPQQRRGVKILSLTEVWERFSYAGTRAILVLYLTQELLTPGQRENVVGMRSLEALLGTAFGPLSLDALAFQIYGLYVGLFYFTPLFCGLIADRVTGHRKAIVLGAIIMAAGQFCLASQRMALIGLLLMVVGGGLFKPTISAQLGSLFDRQDPRADRAFAIFYVAINVGTFLAPLVCGTLGERVGWQFGFLIAGFGNLISLAIYAIGNVAVHDRHASTQAAPSLVRGRENDARTQLAGLFLLAVITPLFWGAYEQKGAAVVLWAKRSVDLRLGDFAVPVSWILMLNPLFIFLLTPLLALVWARLAASRGEPGTLSKMILGFLSLAVAFALLAIVAKSGAAVSLGWVVAFMGLLTLGELLLSPVGLSLFSRTAPAGFASQVLAIWFFSMFVGNYGSGLLASTFVELDRSMFFAGIAALPLFGAVLLLLVRGRLEGMLFGAVSSSRSAKARSKELHSKRSGVCLKEMIR